MKLRKYAAAISDFSKAIKLDRNNWRAYRLKADAEQELNDYNSAIEDYTNALHLNPSDTLSYRGRGDAKRYLNEGKEAIADYDIALSWNPTDDELRLSRARCLYELKQYPKAINDLTIFLSRQREHNDQLHALALRIRWNAYYYDSQFQNAISDFKTARAEGIAKKEDFMVIGIAYYNLRFDSPTYLDSAIAYYKVAEPVINDAFSRYYYLGHAYADKNYFKLSERYLEKALVAKPESPDAFYVLSTVMLRQRKFKEGYEMFQKSLSLGKKMSDGSNYLFSGIARWGAKQDTIGAIGDFEMASKLGG